MKEKQLPVDWLAVKKKKHWEIIKLTTTQKHNTFNLGTGRKRAEISYVVVINTCIYQP